MNTVRPSRPILLPFILLSACVIGCSADDTPELANVRGVVTIDGQPLFPGIVVFKPTEGRASMAQTSSDGSYELIYLRDIKGAKLGQHIVRISNGTGDPPNKTLPARYNSQSTLSAMVDPGANHFDFDLQTGPSR